jgi:lysophospholipase L1-like esterase
MGILDVPSYSKSQSDSKFAQNAKPYQIFGGLKAVFLGDSITNRSSSAGGRGFIDQISKILGSAVISPIGVEINSGTTNTLGISVNAGIPGNTSAQMLARYSTDVKAYNPQVLFILAGTNDVSQTVTLATFAANISAIVALAKQDGIPVIIGTVPPRGASVSTTTTKTLTSQYNNWLKMWCPRNGVYLADVWSKLITANTEVLKTGYDSGDGIHPETLGHQQIAEAFITAFGSLHTANHLVMSTETINLVSNPGFYSATTGWYEQPGVSTGGTVTYSRVTDSSGKLAYGSWLQMDFNTTSSAGNRYYCTQLNGLTAGNTYLITARLDYNDITGGFYASAGSASIPSDLAFELRDVSFASLQTVLTTSVKQPGPIMIKYTLPAGKTQLVLCMKGKLSISQNVQFRLGEVGVYDITALPTLQDLI